MPKKSYFEIITILERRIDNSIGVMKEILLRSYKKVVLPEHQKRKYIVLKEGDKVVLTKSPWDEQLVGTCFDKSEQVVTEIKMFSFPHRQWIKTDKTKEWVDSSYFQTLPL